MKSKKFTMKAAILFYFIICFPAFASVEQLEFEGEATPTFKKSRFVKPIDMDNLQRFHQKSIKCITFHHEGFANGSRSLFKTARKGRIKISAVERVNNIHNQHVLDSFGMIAYNYAIGPSGEIVRGRPVKFAPATYTTDLKTGNKADFEGHFAVVALADFDFENIDNRSDQVSKMIKVMSAAQRRYRVPTRNIKTHRDHISHNGKIGTTCPGKNLYSIREEIKERTRSVSLQTELAARGCYTGPIDGDFGKRSRAALKRLQSTNSSLGSLAKNDQTLWTLLDNPKLVCN